MGSRGTKPKFLDEIDNRSYKTVGYIGLNGEILEGIIGGCKNNANTAHSLPEVSHKANVVYVKLKKDGTFHELKVFKNNKCVLEIDYLPEPYLDKSRKPILHAHDIVDDNYIKHPTPRFLTKKELEEYKEYFIGVNLKGVKTND